ncbi:hypothetical protein CRYUN_Cryun35bG0090900 [Craigia yunnanensis]
MIFCPQIQNIFSHQSSWHIHLHLHLQSAKCNAPSLTLWPAKSRRYGVGFNHHLLLLLLLPALERPLHGQKKLSSALPYSSSSPPLPLNFFCVQRKCNLNWQRSLGKNTAQRVMCSAVDVEDEACELVNGMELSIGEGDDNIQAFLFKAVKNNNGTGVLLLSDIFGFQDSATRNFAYQVACHGYNVLVPDLFRGDPWAKDRPKTMFEQWLASQDPKRVANDIATSTKWMIDEFTAARVSKKLGIIGFCYGGGRVIDVLAADQGACFSTAVSFYGTRMDPSAAYKLKAPVLFISGDHVPFVLSVF